VTYTYTAYEYCTYKVCNQLFYEHQVKQLNTWPGLTGLIMYVMDNFYTFHIRPM